MSKLIYRTKPPKKGWTFNESFMTHENLGRGDSLPEDEIQRKAMDIVGESMIKLTQQLDQIGYDPTKVRFQIHFKS